MAILKRPVTSNRDIAPLLDFPATHGEVLSATTSDPTFLPTESMLTEREIYNETVEGKRFAHIRNERENRRRRRQGIHAPSRQFIPPKQVAPEELNKKYQHLGLHFDQPLTAASAALIAKGKQEEILRGDILARGPGGLSQILTTFGGAALTTVLDPLSFSTIFLPGVKETRFANIARKVGRTGARATAGFVEGAISTALLEPIIHYTASSQQLDYDFTTSLYSVAAGGAFGSVLHVGGGKIGDFLRSRGVDFNLELNRASIFQALFGKDVEVQPLARENAVDPEANARAAAKERADQNVADSLFEPAAVQRAKNQSSKSGDTVVYLTPDQYLELTGGLPEPDAGKLDKIGQLVDDGQPLKSLPKLEFEHDGKGAARITGGDGRHRAAAAKKRGVELIPVVLSSKNTPEGPKIRWGRQAEGSPDRVDVLPENLVSKDGSFQYRFPVERVESGAVNTRPMHDTDIAGRTDLTLDDNIRQMAEHMDKPETDSIGDYEAAAATDEEVKQVKSADVDEAQKELQGTLEELRIMVREGAISREDFDEITASFNELDSIADNVGRASDAVVACAVGG